MCRIDSNGDSNLGGRWWTNKSERRSRTTKSPNCCPPFGATHVHEYSDIIVSEMEEQPFDKQKFKELVLYITEKCETDPSFGVTKLNKLLYYCDFMAYVELGKAVTGAGYQRREFGPAPKVLLPLRSEMASEGSLYIREVSKYGYQQKRPMALRSADLAAFSGEEIALIDTIIDACWDMDASQISEMSHRDIGWQLAQDGETIPYETAFIVSIEAA